MDFGNHKQQLVLDMCDESPSTWRTLSGYQNGSYGDFAWTSITALFDAEKDALYYNGSSYSECAAQPGGIAKNSNCWGAVFDLSGVAVSYLYGGFWGGGAAITSRHYICSNHYEPRNKVGNILRFVGSDGTIHTRTILAQTTGSDQPTQGLPNNPVIEIGDLCVFLLDSNLPSVVAKYPVAGDWVVDSTFVETVGSFSYYDIETACPFITTNQNRKLLFAACTTILDNFSYPYPDDPITIGDGITYQRSPNGLGIFSNVGVYQEYPEFQSNAIVGDSGSPVFAVLQDNELALFTVMTYPHRGKVITESLANALILEVDARAGVSTGLTVTVAPDPTI